MASSDGDFTFVKLSALPSGSHYLLGWTSFASDVANGQVVGQLHGACGTNVSDVCDAAHNYTVDGGFFYNYSAMRQWLNPQTGGCTPSDTVVCLVGGRFQVEGTYTDYSYNTGSGHAAKLTDDTGTLWFFSSSNIELLVKFVNSCTYSPNFSVYANGLTNVGVNIKVTDTKYGTVRQYPNALGHDFALIKAGDFQCP